MPTYEYACRDCGEHLEVVQSFKDDPLTTCGACGGTLRKVFSAAGIIFKGSGYYVTDSRKAPAEGGKDGKDAKDAKESSATDSPTKKTSETTSTSDSTSSTPSTTKSSGDTAAKSA